MRAGVFITPPPIPNKFAEKPAILNKEGNFFTYGDVKRIYSRFKLFMESLSTEPYHRFSFFIHDEKLASVLAITAYDNAVMVPIDYNSSVENFIFYLDLMDVDYLVVDNRETGLAKAANDMGLGIIEVVADNSENSFKFILSEPRTKENIPGKEKKSDFLRLSTTSGTTSTPKVVPQTIRRAKASLNVLIDHFDYTADDRLLVLTRIFKGYTTALVFRMLYLGGSIVLGGDLSHRGFYEILNKLKVTFLPTVPAVLSSFARYAQHNELKPIKTSLRFINIVGAPMPEKLKGYIEDLFNCRVELMYGMTEVSIISATYKAPKGYKKGSVGTSYLLDVKIEDDEILVRGDTVFEGYENVDSSESFSDGWFHTGDTGYIDEDGYIYVTGRIKEMINRGGEKVSPYEVESVLLSLDFIKDAAVFPYPGLDKTENVGAAVVTTGEIKTNIRDLRKQLEGRLPTYKIPKLLYIVDEIPQSDRNKVQRKLLYEQLKDSYKAQDFASEHKKPVNLTKTERVVRSIWKKILRKKVKDIGATFAELGGDSMEGAVLLGEIEERLNVRVPVNVLFEGGSVRSIAEYIEKEKRKGRNFRYLVPIKPTGTNKPLFCIHSAIGDAVTYRHFGKYMDEDRPVYGLRFDRKVKWPAPLDFKHLSEAYAEEIKRLEPEGPYNLCGHCWGGVLAFEIGSFLKRNGNEVGMIAMLDSVQKGNRAKTNNRKKSAFSFRRAVSSSFQTMKKLTFRKKAALLIRKIGNIGNFIRLKYAKRIYKLGLRRDSRLILNLAGKTGMLDYAYEMYKPIFFEGTVMYVSSNRIWKSDSKPIEYWNSMASDFNLIEMDCAHNDIVVGSNAELVVNKLDAFMKETDA